MDRLIYTAISGANAALNRQSVLAANLANASTPGFRSELSTYRAVPVRGEGSSTRVYVLEATAGYLDTPGAAQRTSRNLDVMAQGNAWFALQALDGTEAYTRAGSLNISADSTLTSSQGLPMLDDAGAPITVPAGSDINFGVDGVISVSQAGRPPTTAGRLKMVTPTEAQSLQRSADGFFRSRDGETLPADRTAKLAAGVLESSNVNPVEAMVGMINAARQFEAQMRLIQTAEANDKSATQLLGIQ
jgi:flagellar basal-body rod protein FlgF